MTTNLEFSVLACEDWTCESSTHVTLGRSQGSLGAPEDPMGAHAALAHDGLDNDPLGGSVPIGGIDDGLITLLGQSVTYCRGTECDHASIDGFGTLLPVADSGIVAGEFGLMAVLSEPVPRDGVHVSVGGTRQASWRTVLLHCADFVCSEPRLIPIDVTDDQPEVPVLMVTAGKSVRLWYRTGWDEHEVTLTLD